MARVHTAFVGCKVSRADSRAAAATLAQAGHVLVDDERTADLCVVMTCGVTGEAERKSRRLVRRLARGGRPVVVAGCAAVLGPRQFDGEGVVVPGGDDAQTGMARAVAAALDLLDEPGGGARPGMVADGGRTRFTLKVQDGCPAACTYCAVRLVRGAPWSLPLDAAERLVREAVAKGCGEVVLSGVNLGRYSDAAGRHDLASLVGRLCATPGLVRLRLSSIEPLDLGPRLLATLAHPVVARHLHVPLQSGDDGVLEAMGRPYDTARFVGVVDAARAALGPELALTTDVIVGFPAEDEAAFERTLALIAPPQGLFSRVHVFRYSPRPGTASASLGRLPADLVAGRVERALAAAALARESAASARLGRVAEVLVEDRRDGLWRGYSSDYVRYYLSGEAAAGELVTAVADELHADGVKGRIA